MSFPPDPHEPGRERPSAVPPVPVALADTLPRFPQEEAPRARAWGRVVRFLAEVAQTLVLAALIFFAVRAAAQNFRVEGSSMEPGLRNGEYLLVNKAVFLKVDWDSLIGWLPFVDAPKGERFLFHGPRRGDVIVFRAPPDPSRDFIKRVIGLPGDTVQVVAGQGVMVNGVLLDEDYVSAIPNYNYGPRVVPPGEYFVLGDNRNSSSDSHIWGMVPESDIIGKAMVRYWPLHDFGGVGNRSINLGFAHLSLP